MQFAEHEHELIETNSNSDKLRLSYNELFEFKMVLQKVIDLLMISNPYYLQFTCTFFFLYYILCFCDGSWRWLLF